VQGGMAVAHRPMAVAVSGGLSPFAVRRFRIASVSGRASAMSSPPSITGMDEFANPIAQARLRSDQTSCRKDKQPSRLQAARNQASW
jgi:hypothetical protein